MKQTRRELLKSSLLLMAAPSFGGLDLTKGRAKKGVGMTTKAESGWQKKLQTLQVSWHYSWGTKPGPEHPRDIEFVPMTWGRWNLDSTVEYLTEEKKHGRATCLLGFNEPDQKSQSNIPVEKALDLWPKLMNTGLRLGSPGCVHPDNEWMKEFMKQADERNLRVDFVAVHDYGGPNARALVNKLKRIHEMYGRPVWITEFGVGDWQAKSVQEHRHSPEKVLEFMQELLPELDKLDFVEKYAWFPAGQDSKSLGTSALFDKDDNLTKLGQFYAG
jgi:hypothetical protein